MTPCLSVSFLTSSKGRDSVLHFEISRTLTHSRGSINFAAWVNIWMNTRRGNGEPNLVTLPNLFLKAALALKTYPRLAPHFPTPLYQHASHSTNALFPSLALSNLWLPEEDPLGNVCHLFIHPVVFRVTLLFVNESVLNANKVHETNLVTNNRRWEVIRSLFSNSL